MADVILAISALAKRYGGLQATNDVTLDIERYELHALIGPNGAGKTTIINQIHGYVRPDSGQIIFDLVDITGEPVNRRAMRGIARSFQITSIIPSFSAAQNVSLALQSSQGHSFRFYKPALLDPALRVPSIEALTLVGLDHRANIMASQLSHGERRQLEIAMAIAMKPKLLLLDEPMAGMGRVEGEKLVQLLRMLKGQYTIVMVEHDMDAVFMLADRISVLVGGTLVATGAPADIRNNDAVKAAYLGHG